MADTAALISPLPGLCPYHLIKAAAVLPFLAAAHQGGHWSLWQPQWEAGEGQEHALGMPKKGRSRQRGGSLWASCSQPHSRLGAAHTMQHQPPRKKTGTPPKCWGLGLPQEGCPRSWDPAERCCLKAAPGHVGAATRGMRAGSPSVQTSAFWGKQPPADADSFCAKFHTSLPKHS